MATIRNCLIGLLLLFSFQPAASQPTTIFVDTELILLIDSSASVEDTLLQNFRKTVYNSLLSPTFLQIISEQPRGQIYLRYFEYSLETDQTLGAYISRGIIRNTESVVNLQNNMLIDSRYSRGSTLTVHAIEKMINDTEDDHIDSFKRVIILIGDGEVDDTYHIKRFDTERNLKYRDPLDIKDLDISVYALYSGNYRIAPDEYVPKFYPLELLIGELGYQYILSDESFGRILSKAVQINMY